jgi:hypothetical protein
MAASILAPTGPQEKSALAVAQTGMRKEEAQINVYFRPEGLRQQCRISL